MRPKGGTRSSALACVSIGLLVAACSGAGPSGSSPQPEATHAATAVETVVPATAEPIESSAPPPPPSMPTDAPIDLPPAASLAVEGGDPVVGALGGFSWLNGGSASPWLPGTPIHVATGERLTMTLADGVGIAGWTVRRSSPATLGVDITGMAEGTGEPLAFDAPTAGTWSVSVELRFARDLGSAVYFWLVEVD